MMGASDLNTIGQSIRRKEDYRFRHENLNATDLL
jgi:hypothetical protein